MQDPYLRIRRTPYEEPHHLNLTVEASNGSAAGSLEIYCNASDVADCAGALEPFPRQKIDEFKWELGSERAEDRFAFYFRFRVFTVGSTGSCAIQLRLSNNRELPDRELAEFCITAEPSQINSLGALFRLFARLEKETLEWTVSEGHLS